MPLGFIQVTAFFFFKNNKRIYIGDLDWNCKENLSSPQVIGLIKPRVQREKKKDTKLVQRKRSKNTA